MAIQELDLVDFRVSRMGEQRLDTQIVRVSHANNPRATRNMVIPSMVDATMSLPALYYGEDGLHEHFPSKYNLLYISTKASPCNHFLVDNQLIPLESNKFIRIPEVSLNVS